MFSAEIRLGNALKKCPQCRKPLEYSDILTLKVDKNLIDRYDHFMLLDYLEREKNFVRCSSVGCEYGVFGECELNSQHCQLCSIQCSYCKVTTQFFFFFFLGRI